MRELNLLVLKGVLRDEQALLRHRETQRALNMQLKTGRGSKEASAVIRARLKRVIGYIAARQDQIFIWKCFGDALAYVYLDRFSVKHAFFETDRLGIKQGAGSFPARRGCSRKRTWYSKSSITTCQQYCATLPTLFATAMSAY